VEVADWLGGLGKAVVISHGYSSESRYGHLSQILVSPGQYVKQGTVIGLVGSTGMSTGAHLHFELWQRNSGEWIALDATNAILVATDNLNRYLQSLAGR
jgi:murein DD-endopeptidase MepM/ murein hydrolase activator NlpD